MYFLGVEAAEARPAELKLRKSRSHGGVGGAREGWPRVHSFARWPPMKCKVSVSWVGISSLRPRRLAR
jgi:hypothetical protein